MIKWKKKEMGKRGEEEKRRTERGFPGKDGGKKKERKENSSVRKCTLIKAVSSEIPFFEGGGSRLLNKLFRVKSLFALPWIIHSGSFRLGTCAPARIPEDGIRSKPSNYRCIITQLRVVSHGELLSIKREELVICMA